MPKLVALEDLVSPEEKTNEELNILKEVRKHFPDVLTSKELMTNKDIKLEWLIDGFLLKGGTSLLVAEPKTGKSVFARQVGYAVANGTKLLNRKTMKGLVFYISVEDHPAWIRKHMAAMGPSGQENLLWSLGRIKDMTFPQGIKYICQKLQPSLIVVDTMFKVFRTNDINDYNSMVDALQEVTEIVRKYGTHMMYIHHVNKGFKSKNKGLEEFTGTREDASLNRIMGSAGISGEVDNIIFITKQGDTRFLTTIPRAGCKIDEVLYFDEKRGIYLINEI